MKKCKQNLRFRKLSTVSVQMIHYYLLNIKKNLQIWEKRKLLFLISPVMPSKFVSLDTTSAESEIHCMKCDEVITYTSKMFWTSA